MNRNGNFLDDYQLDAIDKLRTGSILCGEVGSGKSRTALAYYYKQQGGNVDPFVPMTHLKAKDLYIITTARKRDTFEWDDETIPFLLNRKEDTERYYTCSYYVDSWNNIKNYVNVKDAFFIFDEQRVVGYGTWTKSFLKIARNNDWIILSATPGDSWMDYIPVFVANGFYRGKTDFIEQHVIRKPFVPYFQVGSYMNVRKLEKLKDQILVQMDYTPFANENHIYVNVEYDIDKYRYVLKKSWNIFDDKPIETASEHCAVLRRIVNTHESRIKKVIEILKNSSEKKAIIFYNFDYELNILREHLEENSIPYKEWNGHNHDDLPDNEEWAYLVQYTAGCEGWNCIKTDTIIFYSMTYSYKQMKQASGRINRRNTPYKELYYYTIKTRSPIDRCIALALEHKKDFNVRNFAS